MMRTSFGTLALAGLLGLALPGCANDTQPGADGGVDGAPVGDLGDGGMGLDGARDGAVPVATAPKVTTCPGTLTPPASGVCSAQKGTTRAVLIKGIILAPKEVFKGGQLLIDAKGKIACVACDCSGNTAATGAAVLTCPRGVVSPGLINAHDHLGWTTSKPATIQKAYYDHRHEWRKGLNGKQKISAGRPNYKPSAYWWGELRMIIGASTSIMGAYHNTNKPNKLLRNLDGNSEGLSSPRVIDSTFPLGDSKGTMAKSGCSRYKLPSVSVASGPSAYVAHVSEGGDHEAENEYLCLSKLDSSGVDVATKYSAFIHSVGLSLTDIMDMATSGTMAIWSPRTNVALYGYTASVVLMHTLGVGIGLGTDWIPSGSMNMLRELRCAAHLNKTRFNGFFKDYELWAMATSGSADACQAGKEIGRLKVGYFGDVAIFDGSGLGSGDWPHKAVVDADVTKVVAVLRAGLILHGDANVVTALDPSGGAKCEALTSCLKGKMVCAERETGSKLSAIQSATGVTPYALFFCGTPTGEPSCEPARPGEYSGVTSTDKDGDGVPDNKDNCPLLFNPVRKMDDGTQNDTDGDKVGDACDLCPLDKTNTLPCKSSPNPNDKDGDGVVNAKDNCPNKANKDQKDTDKDKIGDVCDPCPNKPNPGNTACPFTIKEIRDTSLGKRPSSGTTVKLSAAVVTSLPGSSSTTKGFYLREGTAAYQAIYVYTAKANPQKDSKGALLKLGDTVQVSGTFKAWNNIDEIESVTSVVVKSSGAAPTPLAVKTKDLQPGSTAAEGYESHLVQVKNVKVMVAPTTTDDAFWVSDDGNACTGTTPPCTKVDDYYFDGGKTNQKPAASKGETFKTITGIVNGYKNVHSLNPGVATDLVK